MEQATYADAGQQGGAGDDAMEVVGEGGGDPPAKRVQDLQTQIAGLAASIKSYADRFEALGVDISELIKAKRTASDARLIDINNDITDLKAQQAELKLLMTKLEAQQAELKDQVVEARGGGPSFSSTSVTAPPRAPGGSELFDAVVDAEMAPLQLVDPRTVKLARFRAAARGNPYAVAAEAARFAVVPGQYPLMPYFLLDGWDAPLSVAERSEADLLNSLSGANPVVILAASGAGKTRRLLQLLRTYKGSFLVYKESGATSKNAGASDLGNIAAALEATSRNFPSMTKDQVRNWADFGARCVLASRVGVLTRLEARFGALTPAQWLMLQLHPQLFVVNGKDFLGDVALRVFERCSPSSVGAVRTPTSDYLTVVDEAQGLTEVHKGKVRAHRPSDPNNPDKSERSFLSAVVTQSHLFMGSGKAILAGTDLVLKEATKAAESGVAASTPTAASYSRFDPFAPADVAAYLRRAAGVKSTPRHLAEALAGRARFTTRFVELLMEQTNTSKSLLQIGQAFIDNAVRAGGDPRIDIGGVVTKLQRFHGPKNDDKWILTIPFPPRPSSRRVPRAGARSPAPPRRSPCCSSPSGASHSS